MVAAQASATCVSGEPIRRTTPFSNPKFLVEFADNIHVVRFLHYRKPPIEFPRRCFRQHSFHPVVTQPAKIYVGESRHGRTAILTKRHSVHGTVPHVGAACAVLPTSMSTFVPRGNFLLTERDSTKMS